VLVPTMGALHDGHRSPLRVARERAGAGGSVLVSIFVNPLQFGPAEDFDRYPRPISRDLAVCAQEGVTAVFRPSIEQMYQRSRRLLSTRDRSAGCWRVRPGRGSSTGC
jgi:pantoate--beta-alanine ligase